MESTRKMGVEHNVPSSTEVAVPDADQPIDLSTPSKGSHESSAVSTSTNRSVKKRWLAQSQARPSALIPLQHIRNAVKRRAHDIESYTTTTSSTTEDSASFLSSSVQQSWELGLRLDRANSVPYLTALPPLQRQKSLSESRIAAPPKILAGNWGATVRPSTPLTSKDDRTVRWLIDHQQELQLQRMQQMDILHQRSPEPAEININYYTKMVQFMQNQELLRTRVGGAARVSTVEEDDGYEENDDEECQELAEIDYSSSPSQADDALVVDDGEGRKKGLRPMTGKHIRTGTGAKPSTLLELRKKIQARQQMKSAAAAIK